MISFCFWIGERTCFWMDSLTECYCLIFSFVFFVENWASWLTALPPCFILPLSQMGEFNNTRRRFHILPPVTQLDKTRHVTWRQNKFFYILRLLACLNIFLFQIVLILFCWIMENDKLILMFGYIFLLASLISTPTINLQMTLSGTKIDMWLTPKQTINKEERW